MKASRSRQAQSLCSSLLRIAPVLILGTTTAWALPQKGHEGHDHSQHGHEGHDHGDHDHGAAQKKVVPQKGVVQQKGGVQQRSGPYGGTVDQNAKLGIAEGAQNHDFGSVMQGATMTHIFKVKSAGTAPLIVRQVKPTCGCTVSQVQLVQDDGSLAPYTYGDPVEPGTELAIEALLDTATKRNKTQVKINVYANDPVGVHNLGLSAMVTPYMTVTPSFVNFGDLKAEMTKNQTIDVRVNNGDKVALEIDPSRRIPVPDGMTVNLVPVSPDDDGKSAHWQVKLQVGPGLKEGPLGYAMTLKADKEMIGSKPLPSGKKRFYTINANVNGRVLGVISLQPQYLSMGLVTPGQVVKRQVQLTCHDDEFEMGNPKVTLRGFRGAEFPWIEHFSTTATPVPGQKNSVAVELKLDGLPEGTEGSFKGEMVIATGHPAMPESVVTFSGVCRGSIGRTSGVQRPQPVRKGAVGTTGGAKQVAKPAAGGGSTGGRVGAKPIGAKPVQSGKGGGGL